jgi:tetratricopeptide (TPR) repeat protein
MILICMATIPEALDIAFQHHQLGQLQEAEHIYRQILAVDPQNANVWHLLGAVAHQTGRHGVALEYMGRSLSLDANVAAVHFNLGEVYRVLGQLDEAALCYRRALELNPSMAVSYGQLGNVLADQRKLDEAVACYQRAIHLQPENADLQHKLGFAFIELGQIEQAATHFQRALQIRPKFSEAEVNWGAALSRLGRLDEAVLCYRRALDINPDFAEAHCNLGHALRDLGNLELAAPSYRRAIELRPHYVKAANNLGIVLRRLGRLDEAVQWYQHALRFVPDDAEVYSNLGGALQEQGKLEDAATCCRRALELKPDLEQAHINLGVTLRSLGKLEDAVASCQMAQQLKPDSVEALINLGNALQDQGNLDEALACYDRALEMAPNFAEAHTNRAMAWLLKGDFEQGWPEFEWRWKQRHVPPIRFAQPRWDGSPLAGRSILLFAEQGLGDTLHFIRYAPLVQQSGGNVLVECQPALVPLLQDFPGVNLLIPRGAPLPEFDVQAPLVSLPGILHTTLSNVPADIPYLFAEPRRIEQWRQKLQGTAEFKIGIVWQGSRGYKADRFRSLPLREFAPLAELEGVRLFSLQKGEGSEQVAAFAERYEIVDLSNRLDNTTGPFMDTVAVIKNLDLVIAPDTAIAQLAAALGAPVWLLLSYAPDWRWMLGRDDSPWYPTMRLFRQRRLGEWNDVMAKVRDELERLVRERL